VRDVALLGSEEGRLLRDARIGRALEVLLVVPVLELLPEHRPVRVLPLLEQLVSIARAELTTPVVLLLDIARAHRRLHLPASLLGVVDLILVVLVVVVIGRERV
jgi:hypothetical protein